MTKKLRRRFLMKSLLLAVAGMLMISQSAMAQGRMEALIEARYARWLEKTPMAFYLEHHEVLELTDQQVDKLHEIEARLEAVSVEIAPGLIDSVGLPSRKSERLLLMRLRDDVRSASQEAESILTEHQQLMARTLRGRDR